MRFQVSCGSLIQSYIAIFADDIKLYVDLSLPLTIVDAVPYNLILICWWSGVGFAN